MIGALDPAARFEPDERMVLREQAASLVEHVLGVALRVEQKRSEMEKGKAVGERPGPRRANELDRPPPCGLGPRIVAESLKRQAELIPAVEVIGVPRQPRMEQRQVAPVLVLELAVVAEMIERDRTVTDPPSSRRAQGFEVRDQRFVNEAVKAQVRALAKQPVFAVARVPARGPE